MRNQTITGALTVRVARSAKSSSLVRSIDWTLKAYAQIGPSSASRNPRLQRAALRVLLRAANAPTQAAIEHQPKSSREHLTRVSCRYDHRMAHLCRCVFQTGANICWFEIRKILKNLLF